jgi:hypothetical protein
VTPRPVLAAYGFACALWVAALVVVVCGDWFSAVLLAVLSLVIIGSATADAVRDTARRDARQAHPSGRGER